MELLVASALGVIVACAVFLILRARTFPVIIGISLLGYGVNFFLFTMGRLTTNAPPLLKEGMTSSADPLPQALVLTAIVIGFAMTGFIVELALRARHETASDHVDAGRGVPGVGRIERAEPDRAPEFDDKRSPSSGGPD